MIAVKDFLVVSDVRDKYGFLVSSKTKWTEPKTSEDRKSLLPFYFYPDLCGWVWCSYHDRWEQRGEG